MNKKVLLIIFVMILLFFRNVNSQYLIEEFDIPIVHNNIYIDSVLETIITNEKKCNCLNDSAKVVLLIKKHPIDTSKAYFLFTTINQEDFLRYTPPNFVYTYNKHVIMIDCDSSWMRLFSKNGSTQSIKYYTKKSDQKLTQGRTCKKIFSDDDSFSVYTFIFNNWVFKLYNYRSYCCPVDEEESIEDTSRAKLHL